MGVELLSVKKKFATLMEEVRPMIKSQFMIWLDEKVSEFKINGFVNMDLLNMEAPKWMREYSMSLLASGFSETTNLNENQSYSNYGEQQGLQNHSGIQKTLNSEYLGMDGIKPIARGRPRKTPTSLDDPGLLQNKWSFLISNRQQPEDESQVKIWPDDVNGVDESVDSPAEGLSKEPSPALSSSDTMPILSEALTEDMAEPTSSKLHNTSNRSQPSGSGRRKKTLPARNIEPPTLKRERLSDGEASDNDSTSTPSNHLVMDIKTDDDDSINQGNHSEMDHDSDGISSSTNTLLPHNATSTSHHHSPNRSLTKSRTQSPKPSTSVKVESSNSTDALPTSTRVTPDQEPSLTPDTSSSIPIVLSIEDLANSVFPGLTSSDVSFDSSAVFPGSTSPLVITHNSDPVFPGMPTSILSTNATSTFPMNLFSATMLNTPNSTSGYSVLIKSPSPHSTSSNKTRTGPPSSHDRQFPCDGCTKVFKSKYGLALHRKEHTGNFFVCMMCDKKFKQRQQLQTHMRKHYGDKPYHCDICMKKFYSQQTFRKHYQAHGMEFRYSCTMCDKGYWDESCLVEHMIKVHNFLSVSAAAPQGTVVTTATVGKI